MGDKDDEARAAEYYSRAESIHATLLRLGDRVSAVRASKPVPAATEGPDRYRPQVEPQTLAKQARWPSRNDELLAARVQLSPRGAGGAPLSPRRTRSPEGRTQYRDCLEPPLPDAALAGLQIDPRLRPASADPRRQQVFSRARWSSQEPKRSPPPPRPATAARARPQRPASGAAFRRPASPARRRARPASARPASASPFRATEQAQAPAQAQAQLVPADLFTRRTKPKPKPKPRPQHQPQQKAKQSYLSEQTPLWDQPKAQPASKDRFPDPFSFIRSVRDHVFTLEFVYLVPRSQKDPRAPFNPYDLVTIDHDELPSTWTRREAEAADFYTLSVKGLTHYHRGAVGFTPLGRWEYEYNAYHAVACMRVFRQFRVSKTFQLWRHTVRSQRIGRRSRALREQLFLIQPTLQRALRTTIAACEELTHQRLFATPVRTHTLAEFQALQAERAEGSRALLAAFYDEVRAVTVEACAARMEGASFEVAADDADAGRLHHILSYKPADVKYTQAAARRKECKRLVRYIKLVDKIVKRTLHTTVLDNCEALRRLITRGGGGGAGSATRSQRPHLELERAFLRIDADGSGTLDADEIAALLSDVYHGRLSDEDLAVEVERFLAKFDLSSPRADSDGEDSEGDEDSEAAAAAADGVVTFDEFKAVLQRDAEAEHARWEATAADLVARGTAAADPQQQGDEQPLVEVELLLEDDGLRFEPALDDVRATCDALMEAFVDAVAGVRTVFHHADLAPFRRGAELVDSSAAPPGPEAAESAAPTTGVAKALRADQRFVALRTDVAHVVSRAFAAALQHSSTYDELVAQHRDNYARDFDEVRERYEAGAMLLEELQIEVDAYLAQEQAIARLVPSEDIQMLRIDTYKLKTLLLPSPRHCLDRLRALLPALSRGICRALLDDLGSANAGLSAVPKTVEEFVAQLAHLDDVWDRQEELEDRYTMVKAHYNVLRDYDMPISTDDEVMFESLLPEINSMKAGIALCLTNKNAQIHHFRGDIKSALAELRAAAHNVEEQGQVAELFDPATDAQHARRLLGELVVQIADCQEQLAGHVAHQEVFNRSGTNAKAVPVDRFPELAEMAADLHIKHRLWSCVYDIEVLLALWKTQWLRDLDVPAMQTCTATCAQVAADAAAHLPGNAAVGRLSATVDSLQALLPVLEALTNGAMQPHHWARIRAVVDLDALAEDAAADASARTADEADAWRRADARLAATRLGVTEETEPKEADQDDHDHDETAVRLGRLIDASIVKHAQTIGHIAKEASAEGTLLRSLGTATALWQRQALGFAEPRSDDDADDVDQAAELPTNLDDIGEVLDDCLVVVHTLQGSAHVEHIVQDVEELGGALERMQALLGLWRRCQTLWAQQRGIFANPDTARLVPDGAKAFGGADRAWRELLRAARDQPSCWAMTSTEDVRDALGEVLDGLQAARRILDGYLEAKRQAFPRLYFVSDADLLRFLAELKNNSVALVDEFLPLAFDHVAALTFEGDHMSPDVRALVGDLGEEIPLGKNLKARGYPEQWMAAVDRRIGDQLRKLSKAAAHDRPAAADADDGQARLEWLTLPRPVQATLLAESVAFTQAVSSAAGDGTRLLEYLGGRRRGLVAAADAMRAATNPLRVALLSATLLQDAQHIAVVERLIAEDHEFTWHAAVRHELVDEVSVAVAGNSMAYGYAYLGARFRLLITPATERCLHGIASSLTDGFGVAVVGAPGSGKTETCKALGTLLGRHSHSLPVGADTGARTVLQVLAGACQGGFTVCFEHIDRLRAEVLSVLASYMRAVQRATRAQLKSFELDGRTLALQPALVGVCATLARADIPKALAPFFRPAALMAPDAQRLVELAALAAGVDDPAASAHWLWGLLQALDALLPARAEWHMGLRRAMAVVDRCGGMPQPRDRAALERAVRDCLCPALDAPGLATLDRLLASDTAATRLDAARRMSDTPQNAFMKVVRAKGLQMSAELIAAAGMLQQALAAQTAVGLVGAPGCGKSQLLDVVLAVRPEAARLCHLMPQAFSMAEFIGSFDEATGAWRHGFLPQVLLQNRGGRRGDLVLVLDGNLNRMWVDTLFALLDQGRLALPTCESVPLPASARIVVETEQLGQLAPGAVSRLGVVHVPALTDGAWRPVVEAWLAAKEAANPLACSTLRKVLLTGEHLGAALEHVAQGGYGRTPAPLAMTRTTLAFLDALLAQGLSADARDTIVQVELLCVFAIAWGAGLSLDDAQRRRLDEFLRAHMSTLACGLYGLTSGSTLFDCQVDLRANAFVRWGAGRAGGAPEPVGWQVLVPTPSTARFAFLATALLREGRRVLLTGSAGAGKSLLARWLLQRLCTRRGEGAGAGAGEGEGEAEEEGHAELDRSTRLIEGLVGALEQDGTPEEEPLSRLIDERRCRPIAMSLCESTPSTFVATALRARLRRERRDVLQPPPGEAAVVFVDDVCLPAEPEHTDQSSPLELLRSVVTFGGLYEGTELRPMQRWTLLAAGSVAAAGHDPESRLLRHFTKLHVGSPDEAETQRIVAATLQHTLSDFSTEVRRAVDPLAARCVGLAQRLARELPALARLPHCAFDGRGIMRLVGGLLRARPHTVSSHAVLARLFAHEALRVFADPAPGPAARAAVSAVVRDEALAFLGLGPDRPSTLGDALAADGEPMLWSDMSRLSGAARPEQRYVEVCSAAPEEGAATERYGLDAIRALVRRHLPMYSSLVLAEYAVAHTVRLVRLLQTVGGHALLCGRPGAGRHTLLRLACAITATSLHTVTAGEHAPGSAEQRTMWRKAVKEAVLTAGVERQPAALLVLDAHLLADELLESLCEVLTYGESFRLFSRRQQEAIGREVPTPTPGNKTQQQSVTAASLLASQQAAWSAALQHVHEHLSVMVSVPSKDVEELCARFPALAKTCCVVEFDKQDCTRASREGTATAVLVRADGPAAQLPDLPAWLGEPQLAAAAAAAARVHTAAVAVARRHGARTSLYAYTHMLTLSRQLMAALAARHEARLELLRGALRKIDASPDALAAMGGDVAALEAQLAEEAALEGRLDEEIADAQEQLEQAMQEFNVENIKVRQHADVVQNIAADARAELDAALPALEAANEALAALDKKDLFEIKSFINPPVLVRLVMDAVCVLLGEDPDPESARRLLSDSHFVQRLIDFDKDDIPAQVVSDLQVFIGDPRFTPAEVANHSHAARSLCMWVHAVNHYHGVVLELRPKRDRLAQAEEELGRLHATLRQLQAHLSAAEDRVAGARQQRDECAARRAQAEASVQTAGQAVEGAAAFASSLHAERERWTAELARREQQRAHLVGDALVSAACISYGADLAPAGRAELQAAVRGVPGVDPSEWSEMHAAVSSEAKRRQWAAAGLPDTAFFHDSATMLTTSQQFPLAVDPNGLCAEWLRGMGVRVVDVHSPALWGAVLAAAPAPTALVVAGVTDYLPQPLLALLQPAHFSRAGHAVLVHEGVEVAVHAGFQLVLLTEYVDVRLPSRLLRSLNVISFRLTQRAAADALYGAMLTAAQPREARRRKQQLAGACTDLQQAEAIDTEMLERLVGARGNVVEDEELLEALGERKSKFAILQDRIVDGLRQLAEPSELRRTSDSVAAIYAASGFATALAVVRETLVTSAPANVLQAVFSLVASDLPFSALATASLRALAGRAVDADVPPALVLSAGTAAAGEGEEEKQPPPDAAADAERPDWVDEWQWGALRGVGRRAAAHVAKHQRRWRNWSEDESEECPLPRADDLERFLALLVFKPELARARLAALMRERVGPDVGEHARYNGPDAARSAYPGLVVPTDPCKDPVRDVLALAAELDAPMTVRVLPVGMPFDRLKAELVACMRAGHWAVIENAELAERAWPDEYSVQTLHEALRRSSDDEVKQEKKRALRRNSLVAPAASKLETAGAQSKLAELPPSSQRLAIRRSSSVQLPQLSMAMLNSGVPLVPRERRERWAPPLVHPNFRLWLTTSAAGALPGPVARNSYLVAHGDPVSLDGRVAAALGEVDADGPEVVALALTHEALRVPEARDAFVGWNRRYAFDSVDLRRAAARLQQGGSDWDSVARAVAAEYAHRVTDPWDLEHLQAVVGKLICAKAEQPEFCDYPEGFGDSEAMHVAVEARLPEWARAEVPRRWAASVLGGGARSSPSSSDESAADLLAGAVAALAPLAAALEETAAAAVEVADTDDDLLQRCLHRELVELREVGAEALGRVARLEAAQLEGNWDAWLRADWALLRALARRETPHAWARATARVGLAPREWVADLAGRLRYLAVAAARPPVVVFAPALRRPGALAYLAGGSVATPVTAAPSERPAEGIYITGLHLRGASVHPLLGLARLPPGAASRALPVLHLGAGLVTSHYRCPVYATDEGSYRTHSGALMEIDIPTRERPEEWAVAGVAAFCAHSS